MRINPFSWERFLEIGVEKIDDEHKKFLNIVSRLDINSEHTNQSQVIRILQELSWYVDEHFAHEEELMLQTHYPEYANHAKLHKVFKDKYHEWVEKITNRWQPWYGGSFQVFMCEWLLIHMIDEDLRVGVWIREKKWVPKPIRIPLTEVIANIEKKRSKKLFVI